MSTTSAASTTGAYNLTMIADAFLGERLTVWDIVVVVIYFFSVIGVGVWSMYSTNRSTVGGYFLAGRSISWWPIGASLFSSNVGSGHFVGLSGSGAASGIAVGTYEWNAMFIVLLLAWVFLPVYIASGVVTMPEYLKKRFGGQRLQVCIALLYLFIYIFTKIAVDLYAGAIFIHEALKWDLYPSVIGLLVITAFYTIGGGLAAVIYTDTLQTGIMLLGAVVLMIVGFVNVGGYFGLVTEYMKATPTYTLLEHPECGIPLNDSFHVFREVTDEDFPWTGVVLGMPILSIWYWCSDQVIVQRTLAAKNLTHAKGGALLCSYLKILPMFLMVMVGMISRAKFPEQVGCVVPEICQKVCGNPTSCSDIAYPKMVMEFLPIGARGLMMSVILAALMSSLTSIFNSSSTLFTIDLWQRARSKASERELMIVGRVFIIFLVILSVLWIPVIQAQEGGQLFTYIQKVSSYFQPPVAICFLLAVFWRRTNEQGAFWGLFTGIIIGSIKMILDFVYPPPPCGTIDDRPSVVKNVHYLHFAVILALLTAIIIVLVSICSPARPASEYGGLTWWTRHDVKTTALKTEKSALVTQDEICHRYNDFSPQLSVDNEEEFSQHLDDNDLGRPSIIPRFSLPAVSSVTYDGKNVQINEHSRTPTSNEPASESNFELSNKVDIPIWKKVAIFICGLDSSKKSVEVTNENASAIQSLEEDPFWRKVVNYNMIVCVVVAISLWIIFR
ncbi:sodium/mannose cotransporter SLC5A10-like isoform X1 [Styela clava]